MSEVVFDRHRMSLLHTPNAKLMTVHSRANDRKTVMAAFIVPMANCMRQQAVGNLSGEQSSPAGSQPSCSVQISRAS